MELLTHKLLRKIKAMTHYKYYIALIFVAYSFFANGQKNYQGNYAGTFMGGRVACLLKISGDIVVGSMYDGPENNHSITATIEGDKFNGSIYHKVFGEGVLEGSFKEDSLILMVYFFDNALPFLLKKQSDKLKFDVDKIFGKPHLDKNLFGDWLKIDLTDLNGKKVVSKVNHKYITFSENGYYTFSGEPLKSGVEFNWYVVGNELYEHVSNNVGFSYDFSAGTYQIKNDTLTLTERIKFKTIETYLRKK
jgi:hypothetical protein